MKNTTGLLILFFIGGFAGVWAQKKADFSKLAKNEEVRDGFFFYLPRTAFEIEFTITENRFTKGELSEFRETYFQTKPQNTVDNSTFSIENITLKPMAIPDPSERYRYSAKTALKTSINMLAGGIIKSLNTEWTEPASIEKQKTLAGFHRSEDVSDNRIPFFSLGTRSDTIINREITPDSTIIERRIINRRTVSNSPEEMAKEAVRKIDEIRKTKYMLISGPEDVTLEGAYLELSLKELERTEQDLLALFFGRNQKTQQTYRVNYIPGESPDTLFFLGKTSGISKAPSLNVSPVTVTLRPFGAGYKVPRSDQHPKGGIIPYRIPEKMIFSILWNGSKYLETEMLIPQFGATKGVKIKKLEKLKVIFDEMTGTIEFIGPAAKKK